MWLYQSLELTLKFGSFVKTKYYKFIRNVSTRGIADDVFWGVGDVGRSAGGCLL